MYNLSKFLRSMYNSVDIEGLFASNFDDGIQQRNYRYEDLLSVIKHEFKDHYSIDELESLMSMFQLKWLKCHEMKNGWLLNVLAYFTYEKKVLVEINNKPYINYTNILHWRDVAHTIGEDQLIAAYFAYKDVRERMISDRKFFSWNPIIYSDNKKIHNILKKGVTDIHTHLKGSGPYFELTWLSLMNEFNDNTKVFEKLNERAKQSPVTVYQEKSNLMELEIQIKLAAIIRFLLFEEYVYTDESMNMNSDDWNSLKDKLYAVLLEYKDSPEDVNMLYFELKEVVLKTKKTFSKRFYEKKIVEIKSEHHHDEFILTDDKTDYCPDYAISKNIDPSNYIGEHGYNGYSIFAGERYLQYKVFKDIYNKCYENDDSIVGIKSSNSSLNYRTMFTIYLKIQNTLRRELVQTNEHPGFRNFGDYQERKDLFIAKDSFYDIALHHLAIKTAMLNDKSIMETRISPGKTSSEIEEKINNIDKKINSSMFYEKYMKDIPKMNYYFGIHFIKLLDQMNYIDGKPRHHNLRSKLKIQARALTDFKEIKKDDDRIRVIDAANNELQCRPEVFSHTFRYIKSKVAHLNDRVRHKEKHTMFKSLRVSYHVGEDFFDIVDGLRAIEEARYFLNLESDDRLGHATALGIDPKSFYKKKNYSILLSKQCLIDNICWLLSKCRKYNIDTRSCRNRLIRLFHEHFDYVFHDISKEMRVTMDDYYDAWKLRGDCPDTYIGVDLRKDIQSKGKHFWGITSLNNFTPDYARIRRDNYIAKKIYYSYQFDYDVMLRGKEGVEFGMFDDYVRIIEELQRHMQFKIKSCRLKIESNPSSNILIKTLPNYSVHPIAKFYNLGLTFDKELINKCAQISVSINTDDKGIFSTNIENEYAILAASFERTIGKFDDSRYNQEMIYDWLNRIRLLGMEQSSLIENDLL